MSGLEELLVRKHDKRGVLIEFSCAEYNMDKFDALVLSLRKIEDLKEKLVIYKPSKFDGKLCFHGNYECEEKKDEEGFKRVFQNPESEFLEKLKNIWEVLDDINFNIRSGKVVLISGYVFDCIVLDVLVCVVLFCRQ